MHLLLLRIRGQLKEKAKAMETEIVHLEERTEVLEQGIEKEQGEREHCVEHSKSFIEEMKEEYQNLLKTLENKELEILKLKEEQTEAEEYELRHKIKSKEVEELRQQSQIIKNKMEQKKFLMQTQHLRVIKRYI